MSEAAFDQGTSETALGINGSLHWAGAWSWQMEQSLTFSSIWALMPGQWSASLALCSHFTVPRCVSWMISSMAGLMVGGTTIFIPLQIIPSRTTSSSRVSQYCRILWGISCFVSGHLDSVLCWSCAIWLLWLRFFPPYLLGARHLQVAFHLG